MRKIKTDETVWGLCWLMLSYAAAVQARPDNLWAVQDPIMTAGPKGSFDEVAVKDPTVVFFEGAWHLFYTARSQQEYTTGYVSAADLAGLRRAQRHELPMIRGKARYGCAPQVFYYGPQQTWYLIFQTRDANYQPMYATTDTIAKPETWSRPKPLIRKDAGAKWIDFWVICDNTRAYLFYTQAHRDVRVRSTLLESFPHGWGEAKKVLDGIHEAVHIYKVKGRDLFHMVYELNHGGVRSFGLAAANDLAGPWMKVTDHYATGEQLEFTDMSSRWTDMVSHGELIRVGYNQAMAYEPERCRWIIQGLLEKDANVPYPSLPWQLGIIQLK